MFCWLTWNWIISGPQCTWPPSWCLCTCWWCPHAATNTPDVADQVNIVGQIAEKKGLQLCYSIVITGRKDSLATPTLACLEDSVNTWVCGGAQCHQSELAEVCLWSNFIVHVELFSCIDSLAQSKSLFESCVMPFLMSWLWNTLAAIGSFPSFSF